MYIASYKAKEEDDRDFDISYRIIKEENCYYIECSIDGTDKTAISPIGICSQNAAEKIVEHLAIGALRPIHLENVVSDMRL